MNSRFLITSAASFLGIAGLGCLMLPQEVAVLFRVASDSLRPFLIQVLGGSLLGLAVLNWYSRSALVGGIYGRPFVASNQVHFVVGALVLLRACLDHPDSLILWATFVPYALFAIGFSLVMFGPPPKPDSG